MPPFSSEQLFFPPWLLAGPTSKKIQHYFFKFSSQDPGVVFRVVFITGLGIEIGHRQAEPQRSPKFSWTSNPAVHIAYFSLFIFDY